MKSKIYKRKHDRDHNLFWWAGMEKKLNVIKTNYYRGRLVEILGMQKIIEYYNHPLPDGNKSNVQITDDKYDAVAQSCGWDFVVGHAIWGPYFGGPPVMSEKMLVSSKTLAEDKVSEVWTRNDAIYINRDIWESRNDKSSHMLAGNFETNKYYLIDTDRYKMYPELLAHTERSRNYIKIKLNRGIEDGFIIDLVNDKYVK